MNIQNVAVIGAGRLGQRLARLISEAGFDTVLEDVLPSNLRRAVEYLEGGSASAPKQLSNLRLATSIEEAVRVADLIVDCVPDELESKLEIFSLLDRMAPPLAILVTPTRNLSIADLASCTYRSDRCLAVQLDSADPLPGETVVLVSTSSTKAEVLEAVIAFWTRLGFLAQSVTDPHEANVTSGTLF